MIRIRVPANRKNAARALREREEREKDNALTIGDFAAGDRVKIEDGRIIELGWCSWPFTVKRPQQKYTPPDRWFCREIELDFDGERRIDLVSMLPASTRVTEVVQRKTRPIDVDTNGDHDDQLDPLQDRQSRGSLL